MKLKEKAATLFAAVFATVCSFAGIKYWDNPEFKAFDVGDYVQKDLLLHFDGIRNVGADAPHNSSATTWKNLGSTGSDQDAIRSSYVEVEGGTGFVGNDGNTSQGSWTDDGFAFDGKSYFIKPNNGKNMTRPASYTLQVALRGLPAVQAGNTCYAFYPSTGWNQGSAGLRKNNIGAATGPANSMYLTDNDPQTSSIRANFVNTPNTYPFFTGIIDATAGYAYAFGSQTKPAAGKSASAPALKGTPAADNLTQFSLGGFYGKASGTAAGSLECIIGTIHNVRLYGRALEDEELAWNRVIDEARYFDRHADIPVTNAVVATSISGVFGDQPCGAYAVDASGYTFSAPASTVVNGRTYTLTGYTTETKAGSTWSVAESHAVSGATSVTVSASDCIRITWQWASNDGAGNYGLVTYDVDDYIKDGLVLCFDGIRNVGATSAHSSGSMTWKNLGSLGAVGDASLVGYDYANGIDDGAWADDGYDFGGTIRMNCSGPVTWGPTFTAQILADADLSAQKNKDSAIYLLGVGWNSCAFAFYKTRKIVEFHTQSIKDHPYGPYVAVDSKVEYYTAMLDGAAKSACVFTGTEIPAEDGTDKLTYDSMAANITGGFNIGGWGGGTSQYLVGRVKNIRVYNRILEKSELEHNRMVDEARFFGRIPVTNVIVQSTYSYLQGNEANGPYQVNNAYTFTAPESVTAENITYEPDGYLVESWDASTGCWIESSVGTGNKYEYTTASGTVRLTWRWKATYGCRKASDYSFDDLAAGAVLHYDGIFNAGVDTPHSSTATTWVNLGTAGTTYNAIGANVGTAERGGWTDKGYEFKDGGYRFVSATSPTFHWRTTYTAETLIDADIEDNTAESGNFIWAGGWDSNAMVIYGQTGQESTIGTFWFHTQVAAFNDRPRYKMNGSKLSFNTAVLDAKNRTACVFQGTKALTSGTPETGFRQFSNPIKDYSSRVFLASWNSTNDTNGRDRYLRGTIKSIRYYDRVLTEEELVRNRNVDSVRYFGELAVTNVVVSISGEETAYKVEGSYTFDASGKTVGGKSVVGYYTEERGANGEWTNKEWNNGTEYTYTEATANGKTIRLTWSGPRPGMMIIVK